MQLFKVSIKQILYLLLYAFANTILSFGIILIINNALAGKETFLKDYTVPFVQLEPKKTILVFSHRHNTFDKKNLETSPIKVTLPQVKRITE